MYLKPYLLIIIFLFFTNSSLAQERYEFYNGIRGLSMGGVQIATVNDETAAIINPSATGKLRGKYLTVVDPEVVLNDVAIDTQSSNLLDGIDPQKNLDSLRNSPGEHFHQTVQVFPSFVMRNFGFGFLGKYQVNAAVDDTATNFDYNYRNDFAAVVSANYRFMDGQVKLGVSGRLINRVEVSQTVAASSTNLQIGSLSSEGLGLGLDAGLTISPAWKTLPVFTFVLRDIGDTKYDLSDGLFNNTANTPADTVQTLDFGVAFSPIIGRRKWINFGIEYRDLLTLSDVDEHLRRAHFGLEINNGDRFFIRAGLNQGYWTAGLELAFAAFQFQIASFGEEIGTANDRQEDRRLSAKFSFRF